MRVGLRGEVDALSERAGGLRSAFDALDQAADRFTSSAQSGLRGLRDAFDDLDEAGDGLLEQFKELKEFAAGSGLDMSSVLTAVAHLRALKLESRDTIPFLKDLAAVISRSGRGSQELERTARALGEISAKTRLYSDEINQLGNAGVPVWEMLERATGRSKEQLAALVKQGRISAAEFIQAFRSFARDGVDDLWLTTDAKNLAAGGRLLESELESLKDRLFKVSAAGADGLSNFEALDRRIDTLLRSGRLKAQLLASEITEARKVAADLDRAEAAKRRDDAFQAAQGEITSLNRSLGRDITDLEVYAGRAKGPLDDLIESFENLREIKFAPGAFLPVLRLLEQLKVSTAGDVAAQSREIGAGLLEILRAAQSDLNPAQVGALIPSMVEGIRRAYEVAERQLTPTQVELNRLELQRKDLQAEVAAAAATGAERYRNVWLAATNEVALSDMQARESMIKNSVLLADKTIYHADRANAGVLEYLAAQKGITEIAADAKIGLIEKSFDGIESALDRIVPRLYGFGGLIKQVVADLLKLELSNLFRKLLVGETSTAGAGQGAASPGAGSTVWGGLLGGIANGFKQFIGAGGAPRTGAAAQTASGALPSVMSGSMPVTMTGGLAKTMGLEPLGTASVGGDATGGGMGLGSLIPFLTNPITIAVAGAAIGAFMLWRHFRNGTEKKLAKAIQAEYGIDVKEMSVLKQVKELGEQAFGKGNASKHLQETVRLEPVKELLAQYAASTGQSSSNLVANAQYADPNFAANRFIRRFAGGLIPGANRGFDHVPVLSDGGEYMLRAGAVADVGVPALDELNRGRAEVVPAGGGRSRSESVSGGANQSFVTAALVGALEHSSRVIESLERKLRTMRPGDVLGAAIDDDPHLIGKGFERAVDVGSGHVQRGLKKTGMR